MHVGIYKSGIFYHKNASNLLLIVILIRVMVAESQVSESVWMGNNKARGWRNPLRGKIRFAGTNKCGSLTGSCQMCCQHPPSNNSMWQESPKVSIYCTSAHVFLLALQRAINRSRRGQRTGQAEDNAFTDAGLVVLLASE